MEDSSEPLGRGDALLFGSVAGMGIYLSQERPDLVFVIKELASKMSKPTELAMARMKKFLGYVTAKKDYMTYMRLPQSGVGHLKQTKDMEWILESYSDADLAGDHAVSTC